MKFGLFLNSQAPAEEGDELLIDSMIEQTRVAREAGFDLISMGHHYLADYVQVQLMPMLGRLTAETGSMSIAPGILLLPLHHPVEVAEQMTTLDRLAEQAIAGVGAGYREVEFESLGVPKAERGLRVEEGVELMNRLWTEENVTYDGRAYSVDGVTICPRPDEKLPVWIGGTARPAIERAARIGDAWLVGPNPDLDELREKKTIYDEIREANGDDTAIPIFREAFVAPTTEEAVSASQEYLLGKYQRYLEWGQGETLDDDAITTSFDEFAEDRFLIGTPAEVCAEIERYEDVDASHLIFRVHWPGMPYDRAVDCLELMGDEVIPNV